MSMRDDVESIIKALKPDRSRIFEVSKIKYVDIITRIEHTFVLDYGDIHWSNMENDFQQHLSIRKEESEWIQSEKSNVGKIEN